MPKSVHVKQMQSCETGVWYDVARTRGSMLRNWNALPANALVGIAAHLSSSGASRSSLPLACKPWAFVLVPGWTRDWSSLPDAALRGIYVALKGHSLHHSTSNALTLTCKAFAAARTPAQQVSLDMDRRAQSLLVSLRSLAPVLNIVRLFNWGCYDAGPELHGVEVQWFVWQLWQHSGQEVEFGQEVVHAWNLRFKSEPGIDAHALSDGWSSGGWSTDDYFLYGHHASAVEEWSQDEDLELPAPLHKVPFMYF